MSSIKDVEPELHQSLDAEMQVALGDLVGAFAHKHRLSGLSVTTLALHVLADCLGQIGGPASVAYLRCLAERSTVLSGKDAKKLNDRGRRAVEVMAEHYDTVRKDFVARKLQ